jgi:hypothetical protein
MSSSPTQYSIKLQKVEDAIIRECKDRVGSNFGELDMWLQYEDWEFPNIYETEFNKEFSQYISQDKATETTILYAGCNLTYFLSTVADNSISLTKTKSLVEKFIKAQFEDFDNACDYIAMTMYNDAYGSEEETVC